MGSIPGLKKLKEIFNLETDGTIATLLQGKDDTDTKQTVSVDSSGRINLGADIDIGNVHLLDTTDTEISPATEPTLSNIYSEVMKTADQPLDVSSTEVDVDINSQTLAQVASLLELDDGDGVYGEVYRRANALRASLENDQLGLLKTADQPLSVSVTDHDENTYTVVTSADISTGVSQSLNAGQSLTIFINVAGVIDITVEVSPDGGTTWYTLDESPYSFSSSGDRVEEIGYRATDIRFTGSNTTNTTIQILEVQ